MEVVYDVCMTQAALATKLSQSECLRAILQPWSQGLEIFFFFEFCPSPPLCNVDKTLWSKANLHLTIFQHWKGEWRCCHLLNRYYGYEFMFLPVWWIVALLFRDLFKVVVFIALSCSSCAEYIVTFGLVNCGSFISRVSPCIVFSIELWLNTIWPAFQFCLTCWSPHWPSLWCIRCDHVLGTDH